MTTFPTHTDALRALTLAALPGLTEARVYDARGLTLREFLQQEAALVESAFVKLGAFEAVDDMIRQNGTVGAYRRTAVLYLVGYGLFERTEDFLDHCNTVADANLYALESGKRYRLLVRGGVDMEADFGFPTVEITLELHNVS